LQGYAINHSAVKTHRGLRCVCPFQSFANELADGVDALTIKSPYVSRLGGPADTFESRIKIPKALREVEEGSKKPGLNSIKTKARTGAREESVAQRRALADLAAGRAGEDQPSPGSGNVGTGWKEPTAG